jgi:hypothetical protein
MIVIGLIVLCRGAILAQYFRVLILVPATIMATAAVAAMELVSGDYRVDALLGGGEVACALQFGYLLGLSVKRSVTDPRVVQTGNSWLN